MFCLSSPVLSCLVARDPIRTVSVDHESGIHMWSSSFCQRLSKLFRSGKLFLPQKARRLESQKACYGGILYAPPPSLFTAGESSGARADDNTGTLKRDSHLLQPTCHSDLLPLWGSLQGFYHLYSDLHHHHVASCAMH